ncbi:hypothetical protein ISCGN_001856 [Ixodes scapularis]
MCPKRTEATVRSGTTSSLFNSRDHGTVVRGNPCQADVGIHFRHSDVSVLRIHRITVSSAEVQASWKTAKAVYGKVQPWVLQLHYLKLWREQLVQSDMHPLRQLLKHPLRWIYCSS